VVKLPGGVDLQVFVAIVALSTLSNEFKRAIFTELALEEPSLLVW
jgi:hypothetical protein